MTVGQQSYKLRQVPSLFGTLIQIQHEYTVPTFNIPAARKYAHDILEAADEAERNDEGCA